MFIPFTVNNCKHFCLHFYKNIAFTTSHTDQDVIFNTAHCLCFVCPDELWSKPAPQQWTQRVPQWYFGSAARDRRHREAADLVRLHPVLGAAGPALLPLLPVQRQPAGAQSRRYLSFGSCSTGTCFWGWSREWRFVQLCGTNPRGKGKGVEGGRCSHCEIPPVSLFRISLRMAKCFLAWGRCNFMLVITVRVKFLKCVTAFVLSELQCGRELLWNYTRIVHWQQEIIIKAE